MGEFDDLDPSAFSQCVEDQRLRLQQERAEADRKRAEDERQQAKAESTALAEAVRRTVDLFDFLKKAFHGKRMSIDQNVVVERTGSRPEGMGMSRVDETPGWIVIRSDGASMSPRHRPVGGLGTPEYVLAARCGVKSKYELIINPTLSQDQPKVISINEREEFVRLIQSEIAGR